MKDTKTISRKYTSKLNKRDGITLISLVITIIILLILAGITIIALTGDNGLFGRAKEAREKSEIGEIIEKARIDILTFQSDNNGNITEKQLEDILSEYGTLSGEDSDKILTTEHGIIIKVQDIWNGKPSPTIRELAKDVLKVDPAATNDYEKTPYIQFNEMKCRVLYNDEEHGLQILPIDHTKEVVFGGNGFHSNEAEFLPPTGVSWTSLSRRQSASFNAATTHVNELVDLYCSISEVVTDARIFGTNPVPQDLKFIVDEPCAVTSNQPWMTNYNWNGRYMVTSNKYDNDKTTIYNLKVSIPKVWMGITEASITSSYSEYHLSLGSTQGSDTVITLKSSGDFSANTVKANFIPVFLLKNETKIYSGSGTEEDPYQIGL